MCKIRSSASGRAGSTRRWPRVSGPWASHKEGDATKAGTEMRTPATSETTRIRMQEASMTTRKTTLDRINRINASRMSRRRAMQAGMAGAAGLAATGAYSSVGASLQDATPEPTRGGRMVIASTGQPAGLDVQLLHNRTVTLIAWNMFEPVFTFDAAYATVPMLAEGIEVSEDGLTNAITLRQGVPFHNGEVMVANDVVASFNRWMPISALGQAIQEFLESITAVDDSTVEITLTSPLVALPSMLRSEEHTSELQSRENLVCR